MAKARKKTTRKKSTKKKTQTSWLHSNLFRLCFLICMICISIIVVLEFGIVGAFLKHFFEFLFGALTNGLFILTATLCAVLIFHKEQPVIRKRYMFGILFLALGLSLISSIMEFKPHPGSYGLEYVMKNAGNIIMGHLKTYSGLAGALLLCLFQSLFDYSGTYVMVLLFFVLAILMFGYEKIVGYERKPKKVLKSEPVKETPVSIDRKNFIFEDEDTNESSFQIINADPVKPVQPDPVVEETKDDEPLIIGDLEPRKPSFMVDVDDEPKEKVVEKNEVPVVNEGVVEKTESKHYIRDENSDFKNYKLPKLNVLEDMERKSRSNANTITAKEKGEKLIEILHEFGVEANLVQIHIGPSVTKFEIKPELGVRVNKISNLQNDIKMGLAAKDIRIEAPIPGKASVGIEIPNVEKTSVQMKDLMRTIPDSMKEKKLLFCLGKDLMGNNVYGELNRMPHLLIAGATGSGKSVCVNAIISSILMRTKPDEVKLVLIDPKKVEFTPYNDVPHLLSPVITDGDLANKALKVIVEMMDRRYDLFGELGVRNITAYNEYVLTHNDEHLKVLPRIVIIIDELADLMLVAAKEVEASIQRITQLARAAGIHLIVATQRPSVDVITGVIKANIPSRIAFAVSQAVDSRTILDQAGAERLLGNGDMLYLPNGETSPRRIQGVFIKDEEVNNICAFVKSQAMPKYDDAFIQLKDLQNQGNEAQNVTADPLYEEVKRFVIASRKASTSLIQRKFSIGYSRAARLMDVLEANGIIGPSRGSKPREILVQNTLEDDIDSI